MKNPLNKRLPREIKHNLGRYLAVFLMMATVIALVSGFLVAAESAKHIYNDNFEKSSIEDGGFITAYSLDDTALKGIEKVGIKVYEDFYRDYKLSDTFSKNHEASDSAITLRLLHERKDINLIQLMKGAMPETDTGIALDRLFAEYHGIKIGDTIEIAGKDYKITGFIAASDYSALFENRNDIMFDASTFGVAVVKDTAFQNFQGKELVNHYSFHFQDKALSQEGRNKKSDEIIAEISKTNVVLDYSLAENNQAISFVGDDMGSDIPMMKTLLYIIIVIMGFVFSVIIGNTIESEAPIIGTLLASGYKKHELICHYMAPPLIISAFSGLCGNLIGYTAIVNFMKGMYYGSYSLPPYHTFWNGDAFLDTTVIPVILLLVINYLFLLKKMSLTPLQFLRKELKGKKGKRAVKLPDFSFLNRFRLRIIFQNKSNYLVLFVGIFFASFILMWGLCITTTIDKYEKDVVNSAKSSYQYILKAPADYTKKSSQTAAEGKQNAAVLSEKEPEKFTFASMESYYKLAGENIEVSVYGIQENSNYFQGLPVKDNTEGVYLSENLLKKLGKKTGDTIALYNKFKDKTYKEKILGTYEYAGALSVFLSREELNRLIGKDSTYFNGYFSDAELKIAKEYTASVITMEDMLKLGRQIDKSMGPMQYIIFLMSVIIFLVLMYILTKVVIEKNAISISFMKVFGYEDKEINRIYLNSITYTVLVSLIVTLPLDVFCMSQIMKFVFIKMDGYFEFYIKPYQYGEIVLIGMLTYFAVNALHRKRIQKIKMADALKMRE
ncbi:ABC transporter permease [Anaerocolumna xylanovorans]|uniref:Putative ABC transport system permease protein n=1 Tax=Anaerocolumna xylanovorans DSM 12503 TaxID=1121345 RepID=A0A1M7Y7L8_9FIRM|nr:ABC transporter permease [Anaerocolumna xylanovorans]SHO48622.1 putative ABC transport system permease protein [Anaerocolumna xylanovorans DSM 12503]